MQVPQIRIQSTPGRIAINTVPAIQEIEQPKAELTIEQPEAEMSISKSPAKLTIDQSQARADMDLKSIARRIEDAAQQGYQDLLAGIARMSQDGDELMLLENGGNAIVEQAKRNSESPMLDFNIGWIPSAGSVKTNYDPGRLEVNWKVNKPIIESKMNKPIINYTPGKAEISMMQYPSLKIDFENLRHVGVKYEQII
ncbi:DUF6470 family protein [Mesobacillus subterraneus]|uniref:YviE n=1 Tax=Mesobacillus subterraneus TaxID=285983 RepID=A0A427TLH7_9BACI|nr:DUF6470 family protein [Mesobacillus subterraneus]RSD25201.1 hypothetical protein EJA10_18215 [Mesobacillus subterraneus]